MTASKTTWTAAWIGTGSNRTVLQSWEPDAKRRRAAVTPPGMWMRVKEKNSHVAPSPRAPTLRWITFGRTVLGEHRFLIGVDEGSSVGESFLRWLPQTKADQFRLMAQSCGVGVGSGNQERHPAPGKSATLDNKVRIGMPSVPALGTPSGIQRRENASVHGTVMRRW